MDVMISRLVAAEVTRLKLPVVGGVPEGSEPPHVGCYEMVGTREMRPANGMRQTMIEPPSGRFISRQTQ
jgi:hypothetical protein